MVALASGPLNGLISTHLVDAGRGRPRCNAAMAEIAKAKTAPAYRV